MGENLERQHNQLCEDYNKILDEVKEKDEELERLKAEFKKQVADRKEQEKHITFMEKKLDEVTKTGRPPSPPVSNNQLRKQAREAKEQQEKAAKELKKKEQEIQNMTVELASHKKKAERAKKEKEEAVKIAKSQFERAQEAIKEKKAIEEHSGHLHGHVVDMRDEVGPHNVPLTQHQKSPGSPPKEAKNLAEEFSDVGDQPSKPKDAAPLVTMAPTSSSLVAPAPTGFGSSSGEFTFELPQGAPKPLSFSDQVATDRQALVEDARKLEGIKFQQSNMIQSQQFSSLATHSAHLQGDLDEANQKLSEADARREEDFKQFRSMMDAQEARHQAAFEGWKKQSDEAIKTALDNQEATADAKIQVSVLKATKGLQDKHRAIQRTLEAKIEKNDATIEEYKRDHEKRRAVQKEMEAKIEKNDATIEKHRAIQKEMEVKMEKNDAKIEGYERDHEETQKALEQMHKEMESRQEEHMAIRKSMEAKIEELKVEIEKSEATIEAYKRDQEKHREMQKTMQAKLEKSEATIEAYKRGHENTQEAQEQVHEEMENLKEKHKAVQKSMEARIEKLKVSGEKRHALIEGYKQDHKETQKALEQVYKEMEVRQEKHMATQKAMEARIEEYKRDHEKAQKALEQAYKEMENQQEKHMAIQKMMETKMENLKVEIEKNEATIEGYKQDHEKAQKAFEQVHKEMENLQKEYDALKSAGGVSTEEVIVVKYVDADGNEVSRPLLRPHAQWAILVAAVLVALAAAMYYISARNELLAMNEYTHRWLMENRRAYSPEPGIITKILQWIDNKGEKNQGRLGWLFGIEDQYYG